MTKNSRLKRGLFFALFLRYQKYTPSARVNKKFSLRSRRTRDSKSTLLSKEYTPKRDMKSRKRVDNIQNIPNVVF